MPEGMTRVFSPHAVGMTIDRLTAAACARGMGVFARIDHALAAGDAGLTLRPAEVLIFGSPRAGTPLMQSAATTAIDLPLKALAWQDDAGATWLGFNDPEWIARRHGAGGVSGTVAAMTSALLAIVNEAVGAVRVSRRAAS